MDVKCGIYKYVNNGNIIYIGRTKSSLRNRINAHRREKKFQSYLLNSKVYYFSCKSPADANIYEKYLINKYKPVLNAVDKYDEEITICINEPEWKEYIESDFSPNIEKDNRWTDERYAQNKEYWKNEHQRKLNDEIRKIESFKWLYQNMDKIQNDGAKMYLYIDTKDERYVPINAYFHKEKGTYSFSIIQRWAYKGGKDIVYLEFNANGLKNFYENYAIIMKQQIERTKLMADKWGLQFEN